MIGQDPNTVASLHVQAHLLDGIVLTEPPMLDALLAWTAATRVRQIALDDPALLEPIAIPIQREPGGRFHLCSSGFCRVYAREIRFKNRRAPWHEYALLGQPDIRRVQINHGSDKSYHVPYTRLLVDSIDWWCLGDRELIQDLLLDVHYIGRYRGAGNGRVAVPWVVEQCDPWPGFPVLHESQACRPLPLDWPDLAVGRTGFACLTYPYWNHAGKELVALPSVTTNWRMTG